jgi:hypothetical protein
MPKKKFGRNDRQQHAACCCCCKLPLAVECGTTARDTFSLQGLPQRAAANTPRDSLYTVYSAICALKLLLVRLIRHRHPPPGAAAASSSQCRQPRSLQSHPSAWERCHMQPQPPLHASSSSSSSGRGTASGYATSADDPRFSASIADMGLY